MNDVISGIKVFKTKTANSTFVGRGEVTLAGVVLIKYSVVNGKNGLFVSLPSRSFKGADGDTKYENQVIVGADLYKELQTAILKEFEKLDKIEEKSSDKSESDNLPF